MLAQSFRQSKQQLKEAKCLLLLPAPGSKFSLKCFNHNGESMERTGKPRYLWKNNGDYRHFSNLAAFTGVSGEIAAVTGLFQQNSPVSRISYVDFIFVQKVFPCVYFVCGRTQKLNLFSEVKKEEKLILEKFRDSLFFEPPLFSSQNDSICTM